MKKILSACCVTLLMMTGCATPTSAELERADYGSYPKNFESTIRAHLRSQLKDPDSAQITFLNSPKSGWYSLGGLKYGYVVCARINAKNSFGAYVGYRPAYFMIRNDIVIDSSLGDGNYGDAMVQGKCKAFI